MKEWFDTNIRGFVLKDIFGMSAPALIALICFAALGVGLIAAGKKKSNWNARTLAQAALSIAIAFILSCIRLYRMPNGGSVVLCSMLPLVAFSAAAGFGRGLVACVAYGFLQIAQGAWIVHPIQGFLDYIASYAMLCLGCLAPKLPLPERWQLPAGCIVAALGRWLMHVVAGVVFFAADAIDAGQAPFVYSGLYNLFLLPEAVLCAVVAATPAFRRVYSVMQRSAK